MREENGLVRDLLPVKWCRSRFIALLALAAVFSVCLMGCSSPQEPVAVVLGERIYSADLQPDERTLDLKRDDLSSTEFAAWQDCDTTERLIQLISGPLLER